ncbi:hypothetical protein CAPTEDRAFT_187448 [Capitella teleta]|uniref:Uncharacterized protein n=1 Tax=Capitella teleta TaxID=283909 RepID=R7VEP3_CAPTE|nr:hypothetical protein CAPTEDRAFT_187448 [Capitella teleta]|eukprot:ELU17308.1 hypothetical protein CAPTEDRAFT_187448 [Capitella teleta]
MSGLHVLDTTATGLHKKGGGFSPLEENNVKTSALIEEETPETPAEVDTDASDSAKENDTPKDYISDKKTDEQSEAPQPRSLLWRVGSGLYGTTTGVIGGAVGLGTGSVKWVAGKSYDATSVVLTKTVNTTKTIASYVPKPTLKKKDKSE